MYVPSVFIRPKNESEYFYAEVFRDDKCSIHYFDRSISGRYILYLDNSFVEKEGEKNLNLKYFKINVLK
jgi:hypothetical protein